MNDKLLKIMDRNSVSQRMIAKWLGYSRQTVSSKISKGTFTQIELSLLIDKLTEYEKGIDMNVFYINR